MSESNNLPQAISHKKLSYLLHNAKKDINTNSKEINNDFLEKEEFFEALENWGSTTKDIIQRISSKDNSILDDKSTNSLMALGALEVHLSMALQALNAFKNDKDS